MVEFRITKTSDYHYNEKKRFKNLMDLLKFAEENNPIIIKVDKKDYEIEIYDNYREWIIWA